MILSGVTIGDGAAIGAGSVVIDDVPPYAMVFGNPARVHRRRFPDDVVETLLELRWWDLDADEIETLRPCCKATMSPHSSSGAAGSGSRAVDSREPDPPRARPKHCRPRALPVGERDRADRERASGVRTRRSRHAVRAPGDR